VANSQYINGFTYPNCTTECKPGYWGTITNPANCTQCSPGSWSARGAASCTLCALGTYQDAYASTACKTCSVGYAALTGQSLCTPCANCTTGFYKLGCGGQSAGTCPACTVPTFAV
jgi:syndecan 4